MFEKIQKFWLSKNVNPKINNLLHFLIGYLFGSLVDLLIESTGKTSDIDWYFLLFFKLLIGWTIMKFIGERWEENQVKNYGAKHSPLDVALGISGSCVAVILTSELPNILLKLLF
jgi:hypothetical protein